MKTRGTKKGNVALVAEIKKKFVEAYSKIGVISVSAQRVGVDRKTIQRWMRKDKRFAKAVEDAFGESTEVLEFTAVQRAIAGTTPGANTLLYNLLKSRKPESYREQYETKISGQLTIRDLLLHVEEGGDDRTANTPKGLRPPGVILYGSPRDKSVANADRNRGSDTRP